MKRQASEWETIITNGTTNKGLIFKIYKQLIQLNTRKTNFPIKKWEKDLNGHFSKEDKQMAKEHMKILLTSLAIRTRQMKTPRRCYSTPTRMTIIKISDRNKCW